MMIGIEIPRRDDTEMGECIAITFLVRTSAKGLFHELPPEALSQPMHLLLQQAIDTAASVKELAGMVLEMTLGPAVFEP